MTCRSDFNPDFNRTLAIARSPSSDRRPHGSPDRIDQTGAEIVVAWRLAHAFGAGRQDPADVGRLELRIALEQQRGDAAHLGRSHRGAGRHLILVIGRRHDHVDARRGHRDIAAAIGAGEQLVVDVGRGHRDHVRVGARIERRRLRPGIAGRRDQHDALVVGDLERAFERGILGTGEAHVDDADALAGRPVEALEDVEGGALRAGRRWR